MSSDSEVDERSARQRDGASRWGVIALVLGLLAWALVLAIGAYLSGFMRNWPEGYQNTALMKFGIVLGCMGVFLAFWWCALVWRSRRR